MADVEVNDDSEIFEEEAEKPIPFKYSITSYGADYPVDGLVKRVNSQSVLIPEFQRGYVWSLKQASRFVESLLLGLPVPGIFLAKERDSGKLLVIDGQQRLRTLQFFYDGIFSSTGKEFALVDVQERYEKKTYKTLHEDDRLRLDDSILHATVVQQEEPSDDESSIYHIFERLNTGGTRLAPQEIRACIFHGEFNALLRDLNEFDKWRAVYSEQPNKRMRDQELILRFFAMFYRGDEYSAPMTEFLNDFMGANRHLQKHSGEELANLFTSTIALLSTSLGKQAFRPQTSINAAVFDSVSYGLAKRLSSGPVKDTNAVLTAYKDLLGNKEYVSATEKATAREDNVQQRLKLAREAFDKIA